MSIIKGWTPAYQININGTDVSSIWRPLLINLSVEDKEGIKSDSVTIVLRDPNGSLDIPEEGGTVKVKIGYRESGLVDKGTYEIDEVSYDGFPQQVTITARAVDFKKSGKSQRSQTYTKEKTTLNDVLSKVAKRNGWGIRVSASLSSHTRKGGWSQDEESDIAFATRLGKLYDANATVKGGVLVFVKKGEESMGRLLITRSNLLEESGYSLKVKARPGHKKTSGDYWDKDKAERKTEEASSGGSGEAQHRISALAPSGDKDDAKKQAQARSDALKRSEKELSLNIYGDPLVQAEMSLTTQGIRSKVDGEWRVKGVTHSISDSAFSTSIEAELPK